MIGGGIYAVLGVVVKVAGPLAWFSFVLAGIVAMCAGYSYIKLNQLSDPEGASPTYLAWFADSSTLAGMAGWTLLFGYVGSIAMYAYAFGSYAVDIAGVEHVAGLPLRAVLSLAIIGIFVGLNLVGVEESGWVEIALVVVKIACPRRLRAGRSLVRYVPRRYQDGGRFAELQPHHGGGDVVRGVPGMAVAHVLARNHREPQRHQPDRHLPLDSDRRGHLHRRRNRHHQYRRRRNGFQAPGGGACDRRLEVRRKVGRTRHLAVGAVLDRQRHQRDALHQRAVLRPTHRERTPTEETRRQFARRVPRRRGFAQTHHPHPRRADRRLHRRRQSGGDHVVRVADLHRRLRRDELPRVDPTRPRGRVRDSARNRVDRCGAVPPDDALAPVHRPARRLLHGCGHHRRHRHPRTGLLRDGSVRLLGGGDVVAPERLTSEPAQKITGYVSLSSLIDRIEVSRPNLGRPRPRYRTAPRPPTVPRPTATRCSPR
nr:APC family permease [Haladaptatus sp. R4]